MLSLTWLSQGGKFIFKRTRCWKINVKMRKMLDSAVGKYLLKINNKDIRIIIDLVFPGWKVHF